MSLFLKIEFIEKKMKSLDFIFLLSIEMDIYFYIEDIDIRKI